MEDVLCPLLHEYVDPPDAVSVAVCPLQILPALPLTIAFTIGFTVTFTAAVSAQSPFDMIREYVAEVVGETTMTALVAPVLHEYVTPPLPLSVVF